MYRRVFFLCFIVLWGSLAPSFAQSSQDLGSAKTISTSAELPLRHIILYVNGVGYFLREGTVIGNQRVQLSFKTSEINDLLKSLTVRDLDGGTITGVTYGSQDPVEKQLQGLSVNLTGASTVSDILTQLRGERVALTGATTVEGSVVSVEIATDKEGFRKTTLNLMTTEGLRSFLLEDTRSIRFLDPKIDSDFQRALAILSESHSRDKRTVTIDFSGSGKRRVSLGYLSEVPAWKTAYRLVLDREGNHFLQGWAIVENSSDEDWQNLSLSLVSGRPISFTMDLATPRYLRRPEVQTAVASGPAPQTYDQSLDNRSEAPKMAKALAAPAPSRSSAKMAEMPQAAGAMDGYTDEELANQELAAQEPSPSEFSPNDIRQGVQGYGTLESGGTFVRYKINVPVNLPRHGSAMFPLFEGKVQGKKVSVYSAQVDPKRPLLGLQLENTTPYTLLAGPITIFDSLSYAGDALIEDLGPGAQRFITYAVDMETEVAPASEPNTEKIVSMTAVNGVFNVGVSAHREYHYVIKNDSDEVKSIVIVHPLDDTWHLVSPEKATETTRDSYRFEVTVPGRGSDTLRVVEEKQLAHSFGLGSLTDTQLRYYASDGAAKGALKEAFAKISEKRGVLQGITAERQDAERKLQQIKDEQSRIRSNMNAISSSSDLYKKYLSTLASQEATISGLLESIDGYYGREKTLKADLDNYIRTLSF